MHKELKRKMMEELKEEAKKFLMHPTAKTNDDIYKLLKNIKMLDYLMENTEDKEEMVKSREMKRDKKGIWSE